MRRQELSICNIDGFYPSFFDPAFMDCPSQPGGHSPFDYWDNPNYHAPGAPNGGSGERKLRLPFYGFKTMTTTTTR
jgi:hypothetical protein